MEEMNNKLKVSVRHIPDGTIIDMQGEINKNGESTLLNLIDWNNLAPKFIIFNFENISYINSAGISIIIRIIRSCSDRETIIFGYGISTLQEKLFKAVGITEYILFYPDEYSILQRIKSIAFSE